jgi:hypothetical protein
MTVSVVWHLLGSVLALCAVGGTLWWVSKRSKRCVALLGTGIILRACIGLALFCISYYQLPIARSLQSGGGFWEVAPDARTYYRMASIAAEHGMATIPWDRGSPAFIVLLALWMRLVGQSPAAGFFMNIVAYACVSGIVVARFRPERPGHEWPCLLVILSYTFSPALLIHGSQSLKDELFVYIVGLALIGASVCLPRLIDGAKSVIRPGSGLIAFVGMGAALYLIAGIRAYYGLTLWTAIATVLVAGGLRQPARRLVKYFGAAFAALALLWLTYAQGAGAAAYTQLITPTTVWATGVLGVPSFASSILKNARGAFEIMPGGTNLRPATNAPASGDDPQSSELPIPRPSSTPRRIAFGIAVLAVPMSLIRALRLVDFPGGRGLLVIADIDTIFLDVTILAGLLLLAAKFERVKRNWTFALTAGLVGVVTAVLLGYVVTNYGTLFRLRLLAAMPFWLLPLAAIDDEVIEPAIRPRAERAPTMLLPSVR